MKLLSLLHFFKSNLTSFRHEMFLSEEEKKYKTVSNGLFSHAPRLFLTRNKQTTTLQRQLSRPCTFFSHHLKNHIERFDVSLQHSLRQTGN